MPNLFYWLWPAFCFLLIILWLWTLLRRHRAVHAGQPPTQGPAYRLVEAEDALKAAYALGEVGDSWDCAELARSVGLPERLAREMVEVLSASGWVDGDAESVMHLTEAGKARAQELIRAHRLWERYLVDREGMPLDAVHAEAHRREHETTPEELEKLDAELEYPPWDPHGHAIPASGCGVPPLPGHLPLREYAPGSRLRITCLDDEPAELLAQLVALGLEPGVNLEVLEQEPDLVQLRLFGKVVPLAAAAAKHVSVVPVPALSVPLGELQAGDRAQVVEIRGSGKHQRRMLDMGFVPGAEVTIVRKAPLGDPVEYRVKGTAVALRRREADSVLVMELRDE